LNVPLEVLEERLLRRWRDLGLSEADAKVRALGNDIPNAKFVIKNSSQADLAIEDYLP